MQVCRRGSANAAMVLVDFSDAASPAAPDDNGNYWNSADFGSGGTALITTDNTASGWSIATDTGNYAGAAANNNGNVSTSPLDVTAYWTDGIFINGAATGKITVTLSGLGSTAFTFQMTGGRDDTAQDGTITVNVGTSSSPSYTLVDNDADSPVTEFNVTPDSGVIEFVFSRPTTTTALWHGFSMTEVPEPASLALLGIGGLMMMIRRRK